MYPYASGINIYIYIYIYIEHHLPTVSFIEKSEIHTPLTLFHTENPVSNIPKKADNFTTGSLHPLNNAEKLSTLAF